MTNKYKHLLFDFDLTFWDVPANQKGALEELYDRFEMSRFFETKELWLSKFKCINSALWLLYRDGEIDKDRLRTGRFVDLCKSAGVVDLELGKALGDAYVATVPLHNKLLPYSVEILDYLKAKGYSMSLITNGLNEVQYKKVECSGLAEYFCEVTTSDSVGVNKPNPFIFEEALRRVNTAKEDAIMIGDDPYNDIYGASQFGLDTIYLNVAGNKHELSPTYEINHLSQIENIL